MQPVDDVDFGQRLVGALRSLSQTCSSDIV